MDLRDAIADQAAFSLRLAGCVAPKHAGTTNLAFSPLSLHVALSLVAAGSAGDTHRQLVSFLRPSTVTAGGSSNAADSLNSLAAHLVERVLADGSPVGGPRVSFAGGLWVKHTLHLKPAFEQIAASAFKAEARAVDFLHKAAEVTDEVNSWAESATGGLIKNLLPAGSVGSDTGLLLANAVYFKGAWAEKFDASQTDDGAFHLLDGSSVRAPFMSSEKQQFVRAYRGFKSLRLPYLQGDDDRRQFSMYLFLPDARDGIWDLAEKLASGGGNLDRYLPAGEAEVGVFRIPKFKISFGFEASKVMREMGLELPFSRIAELTEMVMWENLFVSGIFHKSFVEVNEEGTEAAAATAVVGVEPVSLSDRRSVDFVADHPFIFVIREDLTGVILFAGHVLNPVVE